jgi:glycine cleavage system H protein
MDGFSYFNIFATKGIEYLIIIVFLILLIPFWIVFNKKAKKSLKSSGLLLAGNILIPQGLFYSRNHTWMYMEKSGSARVGLDDLLLHLTGEVKLGKLRNPGDNIRKGDLLAEVFQDGKSLRILSPVSGKVTRINREISENPGMMNKDPYERGWIYEIKPSKWIAEADDCYFEEGATHWLKTELEKFKDFLNTELKIYTTESLSIIMQDGGALCDHVLTGLSDEVWKDFEKEFLNLNPYL